MSKSIKWPLVCAFGRSLGENQFLLSAQRSALGSFGSGASFGPASLFLQLLWPLARLWEPSRKAHKLEAQKILHTVLGPSANGAHFFPI